MADLVWGKPEPAFKPPHDHISGDRHVFREDRWWPKEQWEARERVALKRAYYQRAKVYEAEAEF